MHMSVKFEKFANKQQTVQDRDSKTSREQVCQSYFVKTQEVLPVNQVNEKYINVYFHDFFFT